MEVLTGDGLGVTGVCKESDGVASSRVGLVYRWLYEVEYRRYWVVADWLTQPEVGLAAGQGIGMLPFLLQRLCLDGHWVREISIPGAKALEDPGLMRSFCAGARSANAWAETWREQVQQGRATRRRISSHHSSHCTNTFFMHLHTWITPAKIPQIVSNYSYTLYCTHKVKQQNKVPTMGGYIAKRKI